jgi:acetylornithine deacetylase/succinyl-diaminopimelate desuccinylase-like protein
LDLPVKAHGYIDAHWDKHLEGTREFLRQPSISAQNVGVRATADLLRGWLEARGARVEYHGRETHPILFAEWDVGAPKTLLVYGMYDVQPVDGQPWTSPPFAAEIRTHPEGGESLVARGACNSKGPLMAFLHAVEALRATSGLPVNLKWTIEGEEEVGSFALPEFYRAHRERLAADAAFEPFWSQYALDGQPHITLGTKGVMGLEFICHSGAWGGPHEVTHSSYGPWIASPAWRLLQALGTMMNEHQELVVDGIPALGEVSPEDEALFAQTGCVVRRQRDAGPAGDGALQARPAAFRAAPALRVRAHAQHQRPQIRLPRRGGAHDHPHRGARAVRPAHGDRDESGRDVSGRQRSSGPARIWRY